MAITAVSNTQNVPIHFFHDLPREVLSQIFSRVIQSKDIHSLLLTDHCVNQLISEDEPVWKNLLESHFPCDFKKNPNPTHPKDRYKRLKIRDKNCRENKFLTRTLVGHRHQVKKFAFHEGMLISGDLGGLIKVWDSNGGKELFTLAGHGARVCQFTFDERVLASIDDSRALKLWDLKSGEEKGGGKSYQVLGHEDRLEMNHAVHDGKLFIKDRDLTLKIFDLESGEEVNLLTDGEKEMVRWIAVHKGKLILGYDNGFIKVFDLKSQEELYTLTIQNGLGLRVRGDYLIAKSLTETIVWDLNLNGREAFHKTGDQARASFSDVRNDLLIAKFLDGSIIVFDLKSGEELCNMTSDGQSEMQIQEGMLILRPCANGSILVFDLNSKNVNVFSSFLVPQLIECLAVQGEILVSFGPDHEDNCSIKVVDIRRGKELYTLAEFGLKRVDLLAFHEGVLYANRDDGAILAWDFNKSPVEFLEENFSLLKELENAAHENLFQKLDPHFQTRLRQHAFNYDGSFKIVKKAILNVQTEVCLALFLDSIHRKDLKRISTFLQELLKIDSENIKLCEYLSAICGHPETKEWGVRAFRGEEGYSASLEQKGKAVLKFKRQFLLNDLGLASEDDCFKKLQCSPEDLEKVGILSREDILELKISTMPAIAYLDTPDDAEELPQLGERRQNVLDLLKILSELVDHRYHESRGYTVDGASAFLIHLYEAEGFLDQNCPWDLFVKQFEEKIALIEEKCQSTQQLSEHFSEIMADVKVLVDEFNALDRQHQMAKLFAYTDQEGLQDMWKALNEKGIYSLAEFLKLEDKNPYAIAAMEDPSDESEELSMSEESTEM